MAKKHLTKFRPYLALTILFLSLFTIVLVKMEVRRLGYTVLKLSRELEKVQDDLRSQKMKLAKLTRPSLIQSVAKSRLTLKEGRSDQYIHVALLSSIENIKGMQERRRQ